MAEANIPPMQQVLEMLGRFEKNEPRYEGLHSIHGLEEGRYVIQYKREISSGVVENLLGIILQLTETKVYVNLGTRGEKGGFFVKNPSPKRTARYYLKGDNIIQGRVLEKKFRKYGQRFAYNEVTEQKYPHYPTDCMITINAWSYSGDNLYNSIVDGTGLPEFRCIILGLAGAGKTTLMKHLMSKEDREKHEKAGKLNTGVHRDGITKKFHDFVIDVGRKEKARVYDSPGVGDATVKYNQILAQASQLFREKAFSCVMVVVPSTDCRLGVGARLLKLILDEGVIRAAGNKNLHRRIVVVGTKRDRVEYADEIEEWKKEIASQLLKDKHGKPLNCKVITTYAKGKGTDKRPYESDLSELREWLRTVPTEIICGQEADPERFSAGLNEIFGVQYHPELFFKEIERIKQQREEEASKYGALSALFSGAFSGMGLFTYGAGAAAVETGSMIAASTIGVPIIGGVAVAIGVGCTVKYALSGGKIDLTMEQHMGDTLGHKVTKKAKKAALLTMDPTKLEQQKQKYKDYIDINNLS